MAANTIPTEILRQIVSYLPLTDLPRTTLISSDWYGPSQEALYREIHLLPDSLMLFLRTLLTPGLESLATHVRSLSITWESFILNRIDPVDLPRFIDAAALHNLPQRGSITNDFVALLLDLLPRVQELHLCPPDSPRGGLDSLDDMKPRGRLPQTLLTVRELSCTWISQYRGASPRLLAALFALPQLRTLEVHLLRDSTSPASAELFPPCSSDITTLHISHWQIVTGELTRVLAVPRALKHLSFTATTSSIDEIHIALVPLRPTLQVLEVRLSRGVGWWGNTYAQPEPAPSGSFADWPALRALRCPLQLILGDNGAPGAKHLWEVVPQALQELAVATDFSWGSGDAVEEFGDLVWRKREMGMVPWFCRATVELHRQDERVVWGKIRELCVSAEVELLVDGFEFVGADGGRSLRGVKC